MAVYKLSSAGGVGTARTNYNSFLAGNPTFVAVSYESIATFTVGSGGSSSITFSSIPQTYKHLQLRQIIRNTSSSDASMTVNGSTAISRRHYLVGIDSGNNFTGSDANNSYTATLSNSSTANAFGASICDILDYRDTNKFKTTRTLIACQEQSGGNVQFFSGLLQTTSAISSIVIAPTGGASFTQYSQFALYGIKGS